MGISCLQLLPAPRVAASLAWIALLPLPGCSPPPQPVPRWAAAGNLLENASFEEGREPWIALEEISPIGREFSVSDAVALSGRHSARLALNSRRPTDHGTCAWGFASDLAPGHLPRLLSGHYRVQRWHQGGYRQYLQATVQVFPGESGFPPPAEGDGPLQISWILAGVDASTAAEATGRKVVFHGPLEVPQGRWVPFELDLPAAFAERWGFVPEGFAKLRVILEARFEGWELGQGEVTGDVYFDDLYLGDGG